MTSSPAALLLNQLAEIHRTSLPAYLSYTRPWAGEGDEDAVRMLRQIAVDHQYVVDKVSTLLEAEGLESHLGQFPMEFTGLHDLSIEYLVQRTKQYQVGFIERLENLIDALPDEAVPREIAEEAWGLAKGHLKNLQDAAADLARH